MSWRFWATDRASVPPSPADVQILTALKLMLAVERQRYDDLLTKYHQLRVQGNSAPGPMPVIPPRVVDEVAQAINAIAGTDRQLRANMWRRANEEKAAGLSDPEIIVRIVRGTSLEEFIEAGDMKT